MLISIIKPKGKTKSSSRLGLRASIGLKMCMLHLQQTGSYRTKLPIKIELIKKL
jgi:hypothetical protein